MANGLLEWPEQCSTELWELEQWWRVDLTHHRHWRRVGPRAAVKKTENRGGLQWPPPPFTSLPAMRTASPAKPNKTQHPVDFNFSLLFRSDYPFLFFSVCSPLLVTDPASVAAVGMFWRRDGEERSGKMVRQTGELGERGVTTLASVRRVAYWKFPTGGVLLFGRRWRSRIKAGRHRPFDSLVRWRLMKGRGRGRRQGPRREQPREKGRSSDEGKKKKNQKVKGRLQKEMGFSRFWIFGREED